MSPDLADLQWELRPWNPAQAYSDSKLFDVALAFAFAWRWPQVLFNVLEPGWVPTKMGGTGAPDDLGQAHFTQAWLAVSDEPASTVSGAYFYHKSRRAPHPATTDTGVQEGLLAACAELTGTPLPVPGPSVSRR